MRFWAPRDLERTPYLESILPRGAQQEISRGILPFLHCDSLTLAEGEFCHYADCAIYEKRIRLPRLAARRQPAGVFRSRDGARPVPAASDVAFEQIDGFLYITSSRVLFSGGDEYWDRSLDGLLAAKPYLNCIKFQFGRESLKVFVPDGSLPHLALNLIRRQVQPV